jgi:proteic killer suppression protein
VNVRFADKKLWQLETDPKARSGLPQDVVKAFRKRMQFIRSAVGEQVFYAMKSLHYEKLKGKRSHQRSMRLNDQFRLIVEIEQANQRTVVVVSIEDYH